MTCKIEKHGSITVYLALFVYVDVVIPLWSCFQENCRVPYVRGKPVIYRGWETKTVQTLTVLWCWLGLAGLWLKGWVTKINVGTKFAHGAAFILWKFERCKMLQIPLPSNLRKGKRLELDGKSCMMLVGNHSLTINQPFINLIEFGNHEAMMLTAESTSRFPRLNY